MIEKDGDVVKAFVGLMFWCVQSSNTPKPALFEWTVDNHETYKLIMVIWSREMWQSVVNRVLRMITPGPFGMHFATGVATVI
ncbi:hypothetical protein KIN20_013954 [Parelaphostrongylus tenuis]|uniref:Uncharacterized protein n=1 Tax=Parelaphostrongylus tenuis TaxID=148309 RepID=A0AAD5QNY0_PARTN|nr:hypothetical protein KIN20_013954 [Parelaphostrongylus tenuis]